MESVLWLSIGYNYDVLSDEFQSICVSVDGVSVRAGNSEGGGLKRSGLLTRRSLVLADGARCFPRYDTSIYTSEPEWGDVRILAETGHPFLNDIGHQFLNDTGQFWRDFETGP